MAVVRIDPKTKVMKIYQSFESYLNDNPLCHLELEDEHLFVWTDNNNIEWETSFKEVTEILKGNRSN